MTAPADLIFVKLLIPQVEKVTDNELEVIEKNKPRELIDAVTSGTVSGQSLALAVVGAMLFSFVSLVALMNGMIGGRFGIKSLSL